MPAFFPKLCCKSGALFFHRLPALRRIAVAFRRACGRTCRAGANSGPLCVVSAPLPLIAGVSPVAALRVQGAAAARTLLSFLFPAAAFIRRPLTCHRSCRRVRASCRAFAVPRPPCGSCHLQLDHHRRSIHAHQRNSLAFHPVLLPQNANPDPAMTLGLFPTLAFRSSPRGPLPAPPPPGLPTGRRTDASFEASGDRAHPAPGPFGGIPLSRRWHEH